MDKFSALHREAKWLDANELSQANTHEWQRHWAKYADLDTRHTVLALCDELVELRAENAALRSSEELARAVVEAAAELDTLNWTRQSGLVRERRANLREALAAWKEAVG